MIAQESIQEVLDRVNIVEIISETVSLRRAGTNYLGLCPFHQEKSPSFNVRETDGYFHCFGCGESGDVISFLMKIKGLSFPEAIEDLALRLGIAIRKEGGGREQKPSNKQLLYKINRAACEFFIRNLQHADNSVKEYLQSRHLREDALGMFGVGYSPREWSALSQYLKGRGLSEELLMSLGLSRRGNKGDLYDLFRGRIMFPVFADDERIAGFGGRILPGDSESGQNAPKYINSPESPLYQKSKIFFGLPQAFEALRDSKSVYLVEGYLDVIGLWQVGVQNVLATCGTALTEQHVKRLKNLVNRVVVLFDGDAAGRVAAGKCFPHFQNSGLDVSAVFLPSGDDPDTFAHRFGERTASELSHMEQHQLIECYIDHLLAKFEVKSVAELGSARKGKFCSEVASVVRAIQNSIERAELIQRAALVLRIEPRAMEALVEEGIQLATKEAAEKGASPVAAASSAAAIPDVESLPPLDREVLVCAIAQRDSVPAKVLRLPELCLSLSVASRSFIEGLAEIVADSSLNELQQKERTKELLKFFGPSWLELWRKAFAMQKDPSVSFEKGFEQCLRVVRKNKEIQLVGRLDREISASQNEQERSVLLQERLRAERRIRDMQPTQDMA